jgi:hypothetical protein
MKKSLTTGAMPGLVTRPRASSGLSSPGPCEQSRRERDMSMSKRWTARVLWIVVAAAVAVLTIGGVSLASGGPANNSNPLVVNLLSRATAIDNFVDTGPAGLSPGDLYVWTDQEFLADAPDQQLGTVDGRCVLIDPATLNYDCSMTSHVRDGQPLPAGDFMLAGTLTLAQGTTSTFAIVGGTGSYRTARGDISVKLGPFQGPHDVTVSLILNP